MLLLQWTSFTESLVIHKTQSPRMVQTYLNTIKRSGSNFTSNNLGTIKSASNNKTENDESDEKVVNVEVKRSSNKEALEALEVLKKVV